jgi:hypothetical protein
LKQNKEQIIVLLNSKFNGNEDDVTTGSYDSGMNYHMHSKLSYVEDKLNKLKS